MTSTYTEFVYMTYNFSGETIKPRFLKKYGFKMYVSETDCLTNHEQKFGGSGAVDFRFDSKKWSSMVMFYDGLPLSLNFG